jgi:purine-binding chemotaxis protein CheW
VIRDADARPTDRAIPALLCRVADLHCAIPSAGVREVMRALEIEPISGMSAFVLGLSIIRGTPTPVVDTGRLLNAAKSQAAYFVLIDTGDSRPVALAAEQIIGLRRIAEATLAPLPPLVRSIEDDAIAAIRAHSGGLLALLDTARLVPAHLLAALHEAGAWR